MIDPAYMAQPIVAEILAEYRRSDPAPTIRQRAILEERLWAQVPLAERRRYEHGKRDFLVALLGGMASEYENRSILRGAPDLLWDRIDGGLAIHTAKLLLRRARAAGGQIDQAVGDEIAKLDALPLRRTMGGRKFAARRPGSRILRSGDRIPKGDWGRIKAILSGILRSRIGDLADSMEADVLYSGFQSELSALISTFTVRAFAIKRRNRRPISRRELIDACRTLHMDPPPPGAPADGAVARKQYRKLARTYHPDSNAGNESTRELYEAVVAAHAVVCDYNLSQGSGGNKNNGDDNNGNDAEPKPA